ILKLDPRLGSHVGKEELLRKDAVSFHQRLLTDMDFFTVARPSYAEVGAVNARSGGPERPANMLEAHPCNQRLSRPPAFQPVHMERQLLNLLKRPGVILPFRQGAF